MNPRPINLICTVGTSLFYPNLEKLDPRSNEYHGTPWAEVLPGCRQEYAEKRWENLGRLLWRIPPDHKLCGAEINSIEAMVRKGFLAEDRAHLILLVSDTEEGKAIGRVLETYFQNAKCPLGFNRVSVTVVEGLQDGDPLKFRREGLSNLVRALGRERRQWGTSMAINATGGYKAQIALAVAFGQATGCPVYYKHERFDQVISFPQVPFTMDLGLVDRYAALWADLAEPDAALPYERLRKDLGDGTPDMEAMALMLERVEVNGKEFVDLCPLGLVYWETYITQNPQKMLEPPACSDRSGCDFPSHHYPKGFQEYVLRVYEAFPAWITGCHAVPYQGQGAMEHGRFYERERKIYGEYRDHTGFGGRFEVRTTATNALHRRYVLSRLQSWSDEQ